MKRFICWLFGHDLIVAQKFSSYSRRCFCNRCRRSFAMNDDARAFLLWDKDFHDLYNRIGGPVVYLSQEKP